jgi:hypothetical protein
MTQNPESLSEDELAMVAGGEMAGPNGEGCTEPRKTGLEKLIEATIDCGPLY